MKKILFSLIALMCSMSMNAQVMKIYNGETLVKEYKANEATHVVFEQAPAGPEYVEIEAQYDGTNVTKLKWAKMNVGATSENNWGDFFAWGETEPRYTSYTRGGDNITNFVWKDNHTTGYASPYATYSGATLNAEHDAATANWGGTWRTPTQAEFQAMYNATKWTWDSTDKGYYVTAKDVTLAEDKSNALLFFPAAGYVDGTSLFNGGTVGFYWSSSLYTDDPDDLDYPNLAYHLGFHASLVNPSNRSTRYSGFTVRPVSD